MLVIALVFAMVVVGGVTRLTGSGLSMVKWEPIIGAVPPLDEADWQAAFDAYKQFPQYREVNRSMDLDGFKRIFVWEYLHRLLGRSMGVAFALPFGWFLLRGALSRPLALRLSGALVLGGLQGLLGWLMVKSGLVDEPRVSHYRLAAHLGLALAIMAWLAWLLTGLVKTPGPRSVALGRPLSGIAVIAVLQLAYGAFVAGLHAGLGYNTFPMMGDQWVAAAVMGLEPWWRNLFEDHATVQFVHRLLGTLLLLAVAGLWLRYRARCSGPQRLALHLLFALVSAQYLLGVYTLVNAVPIVAAVTHQGCAALVVLALVVLGRVSREP